MSVLESIKATRCHQSLKKHSLLHPLLKARGSLFLTSASFPQQPSSYFCLLHAKWHHDGAIYTKQSPQKIYRNTSKRLGSSPLLEFPLSVKWDRTLKRIVHKTVYVCNGVLSFFLNLFSEDESFDHWGYDVAFFGQILNLQIKNKNSLREFKNSCLDSFSNCNKKITVCACVKPQSLIFLVWVCLKSSFLPTILRYLLQFQFFLL